MEVWIENKIGFINGYSLNEQVNQIKIKVEKEPIDFMNWRYDGNGLVYDIEHAPEKEPTEPTEIEVLQQNNRELKEQISELTDAVLFISENMGGTK